MDKSIKKIWLIVTIILVLTSANSIMAQWNKALHFSWWQHDRVLIPDAPSLFPFVLNAGTVEMWFKPDSLFTATSHPPDYTYLFSKNLSGNVQGDLGIGWKRNDGDIQCFIQDGSVTQDVYPLITAWEPRWYHIAYVWDTADSMRVFIDGVQSADIEPNQAGEVCLPVYGGTQTIVLGSGAVDLLDLRYETFRGSIDEVRISAVARYTNNFTVPTTAFEVDPYTIALWHFDEGNGNTVSDATGNGFNGILGHPDSVNYAHPEWINVIRDPKIIINEINVDVAEGNAGDANGDGTRDANQDQFIEIVNITNTVQDLSGYQVGDNSGLNFTFPQGYTIAPSSFVTIFGGGNVSNVTGYNPDQLLTRVFTAGGSIGDGLLTAGDYVIIKSADGSHDVYFAYGDKYGAGAP
ncbi:MAG TPA: lamin tail domain-containing protein [Ignavibacteriaceae bacterium]|nr:lamin tail domain-containing protein [Ignavibacteriaceae bacterium]